MRCTPVGGNCTCCGRAGSAGASRGWVGGFTSGRGHTGGDRERRLKKREKARVPCCFYGPVTRPLVSLVQQDKPPRDVRCRRRQRAVGPPAFFRAGRNTALNSAALPAVASGIGSLNCVMW